MSREHFHESQIEDRVTELMEKGMSDEDAIQQAESEYDGQVNLVEDKALKIHETFHETQLEKQIDVLLEDEEKIQIKLQQGIYASEIILDKVIEHLKKHHKDENEIRSTRRFCYQLLNKIDDITMEVNNAQ